MACAPGEQRRQEALDYFNDPERMAKYYAGLAAREQAAPAPEPAPAAPAKSGGRLAFAQGWLNCSLTYGLLNNRDGHNRR